MGDLEWRDGVVGYLVGGGCLRARLRRVAICARVTGWLGQYWSGLVAQPTVMPVAASVSMLAVWVFSWVSVNPAGVWVGGSWRALTRKLAICARVTELLGQYCGGLVAQPTVISRLASCSV